MRSSSCPRLTSRASANHANIPLGSTIDSKLVPDPEPSIRLPRPFLGGARAVSAEHRPRPPARKAHQVAFLAAHGEPAMREGVAEQVRVDALQTRPLGPQLHDLPYPISRER